MQSYHFSKKKVY